jgi:nitrite reductase/ring-hydroxylating ferredoxin subunit
VAHQQEENLMNDNSGFIRVALVSELGERGNKTVKAGNQNVLLVRSGQQIHALDWRCPHMGFPLSKGSVKDGILTCHWHHARFDLCSGGTFDLFADDVRVYPVEVRDGEIWVNPRPQRDEVAHQKARLRDGLEQQLSLVSAKAILSLLDQGVEGAEVLRIGGRFGATQREAGWRDGLTIMTAMGNILPVLAPEDRPLALYHGMLHVADNVAGQRPHFELDPLPTERLNPATLKIWLRQFAEVRDRDGVERVVLTAIRGGARPAEVADMLFAAVTDHYYLDTGHSIDFINKAFELLDTLGWREAPIILPSIVPSITSATRMEETNAWRHPVNLPAILEPIFARLLAGELIDDVRRVGTLSRGQFDALVTTLLGDDPAASAHALAETLLGGAGLAQISQALCYAAALRVARFSTTNEFDDWIAVLHTLTSANATHHLLQRAPSLEGARSIWHTAMHLYLNRFLNMPAAKLPTTASVATLSADPATLCGALLDLTDRQQQVEQAAAVVYRALSLQHPAAPLIQTLAHTLLREDGEFHSYQMLEAGIQLYQELSEQRPDLAPNVLVAVARYLAAHAPTSRATTQTYRIAARLHAGEALDVPE